MSQRKLDYLQDKIENVIQEKQKLNVDGKLTIQIELLQETFEDIKKMIGDKSSDNKQIIEQLERLVVNI